MQQGSPVSITPATDAAYTYAGYKKSTVSPPTSGVTLTTGSPPIFTYDGTYDKYYLNLYYTKKQAQTDKPDLEATNISSSSAIQVGQPTSFTGTFTNNGTNINTPFNVKVTDERGTVVKLQTFSSAASGATLQLPFSYTFPNTNSKTFKLYVDSANAVSESDETNNDVSGTFTPGQSPAQTDVTGDFDVLPNTITFRDPFKFQPKNFQLQGCTYQYHYYKIERNGLSWTSPNVYGQTTATSFTRSTYPSVIGVGTHDVYMRIVTSCGTTNWIGPKPLEVTSPTTNRPPQFQIAWVHPNAETVPVDTAAEGQTLSLVVIQNPTIPTPYDPDGDSWTFDGFDFAGSGDDWLQQIPAKYPQHPYLSYESIKMDGIGYHLIKAQMHDQWGAVATAYASITVLPPNPVPIIDGPEKVVEGRPLSEPVTADRSYSPAGRSINHSLDEWTNKKDVYTTPGTEIIKLDVYDSIGLKSLQPAQQTLTVLEDLPPVPVLQFASPSIRGATTTFQERSYSPDGDNIVKTVVSYRRDSDNDGNFDEETAVNVTLDGSRNFTLTPTKVGKYKMTVYVKEDWGKDASKDFDFDVVNTSPNVSFEVSSESKSPEPIVTVPLKANVLTNPASGWTNSDFRNASKPPSWGVNPSSGALTLAQTYRNRYSLSLGPSSSNVTMIQTNNEYHGYYAKLNNNYYIGTSYCGNRCQVLRVYRWTKDPASTIGGFGDNAVEVAKHDNNGETYGEGLVYVDYLNQMVYTETRSPSCRMDQQCKTFDTYNQYTFTDFIKPGGTPIRSSSVMRINGRIYDGAVMKHYDSASPHYVPLPYGDAIFALDENAAYPNYQKKFTYAWDSEVPTSIQTLYSSNIYQNQQYDATYNSDDAVSDNQLKQYSFYYRDGTGSQDYGYIIYNPVTDKNEYGAGDYKEKTSEIQVGYYSSPESLIPSGDGKYVIERYSSPVTVYQASSGKKVSHLPSGENFMNLTVDNRLFSSTPIDTSGRQTIKEYRLQNDGSLSLLQSLVFNQAASAGTGSDSFNVYSSTLDNGNNFYYTVYDPNFTGVSVKRMNLDTGAVTTLATGIQKGSKEGVADINVLDNGELEVTFFYTSGSLSGHERRIYIVPNDTSHNRDGSDSLLSQNQLLSGTSMNNIQLRYAIRMNRSVSGNVFSGFSFGAQDNSNMYRVEQNHEKIQLTKVVGGKRYVLQSVPYPFTDHQTYGITVSDLDHRIKVSVNNVPVIDLTDMTYDGGKFGPFAELPETEFLAMSFANLDDLSSSSHVNGVAIVDQPVVYTLTSSDLENDPFISDKTEWTYTKTDEKFLDAGDGKSGPSPLEGNLYHAPVTKIGKVGVYQITEKTEDDPNPDYPYPSMTFNSYRQQSNVAVRNLIVHRPPVVDYDLGLNPDHTIKWTDRSHDPDRYLSSTNFSTENTGIDYKATKGIMEKRFYYVTPSGDTVQTKLVTPTEKGTYLVGMAVKDEYEAWSPFLEKSITVNALPSPDDPPQAGFTVTPGTTYRGVNVTMNSTARDKEDGGRENLPHEYYIKNVNGGTETLQSTARTTWTKSFSSLGTFQIRQVVEDHLGQVDQSVQTVKIVNRIPAANVTDPASSDSNNPSKLTVLRPTFRWTYGDADSDPETKYQIKIYRYGGYLEQDSGIQSGNAVSWASVSDLPEHVNLYVQVRSYDGYDWSDWSPAKFFYIETNRPPAADFDWAPKPVYEGDTVAVSLAVEDPDNDKLAVQMTMTGPDGEVQTFGDNLMPPYGKTGPVLNGVKAGNYRLKLTVSDGKAAPVIVEKTLSVLPLSVTGQVKHTVLWDERRKQYNKQASGSEDSPRGYNVFWAGEKFVLAAKTTETGTATMTERVEVTMNGTTVGLKTGSPAQTAWTGEMWEESYIDLPDGPLTFVFKATYTNGTVKTDSVTVTLDGNVLETVGVHRRQ